MTSHGAPPTQDNSPQSDFGPIPASLSLRDLAVELATEAGALALEMQAKIGSTATMKSSAVDVVTAADKAAEELIIHRITGSRPGDGILGEEGGARANRSGVRWIIDPIDGTTNYLYGLPAYAVSIAVEVQGVVAAGVVYQPVTGSMFEAAMGAGARLNGKPLRVTTPANLATSLIATGFGYKAEQRLRQAKILAEVLPEVRDIRRSGSAALDLCFLAAGQVDAYYEHGVNEWDVAAGLLIASEAGATAHDNNSDSVTNKYILATSPAIFDSLQNLLAGAGA